MHFKRYQKYKPDTIDMKWLNGNDSLYDSPILYFCVCARVPQGGITLIVYKDDYHN